MPSLSASPLPRGRPVRQRDGLLTATRVAVARAAAPDAAPAASDARSSVVQRCDEMGMRLTAKRRRMVEVFDMVETPIDLEIVWRKIVELGVEGNRSSMHRLAGDLVAHGVLNEIGPSDRRTRFATPLSMTLEVGLSDGSSRTVLDPTLKEMVFRALARGGEAPAGRRVVITVED